MIDILSSNLKKIIRKTIVGVNNNINKNLTRFNVLDKEWDYLVVLDGCNYIDFKNYNKMNGSLNKIYSEGSCTSEWILNSINNSKSDLTDIIYLSSNPYVSDYFINKYYKHKTFKQISNLWKNEWNADLNTVHPKDVNKNVHVLSIKYPNNRLIIHYMQPHHPFIGKVLIKEAGWKSERNNILYKRQLNKNGKVWDLVENKILDLDFVYTAYIENLKLVLSYVEKIVPYLNGKICITSDHGNLFGKYGFLYGHPCNSNCIDLISVPWFEISN